MQPLPRDGISTGEIVVRSPWLTPGYFKDQKNSELLWHGGYLHTGDMANIDAKGYIKITDRVKDIIKVGGEWVSFELEDIINQHASVKEVAVIGIADENGVSVLWHWSLWMKPKKKSIPKSILTHAKEFIKRNYGTRRYAFKASFL